MKQKKKKISAVLLGLIISLSLMAKPCFAGILEDARKFVNPPGDVPLPIPGVVSDLQIIINILFTIATATLVIVGLIQGIKYMMSEPNDKAKVKEKLIYYFIAIILVYGGIGIADIIVNFFVENVGG